MLFHLDTSRLFLIFWETTYKYNPESVGLLLFWLSRFRELTPAVKHGSVQWILIC